MTDKKKPGKGRPRGRKETYPIQARVSRALLLALQALIAKTRRSKNVELVVALEAHLEREGFWPPKEEES